MSFSEDKQKAAEMAASKYSEIDLLFAGMYCIEKLARKIQKDIARIESVLSPQERAHLASSCVEPIRDLVQQIIEILQSTPANPNAPEYRRKTKKEYAKIWREYRFGARERGLAELMERVEQIKREIEGGRPLPRLSNERG